MSVNKHSKFWLGNHDENVSSLIELQNRQRVISNFVEIICNKKIPVDFQKHGDSYTDGESITISSDIEKTGHDLAVGLALHEASHILLTDFKVFKELLDYKGYNGRHKKPINKLKDNGCGDLSDCIDFYKTLINVIEDRRIDTYITDNFVGYRGYYIELYKEYFHDDKNLEIINNDEETFENYLNHIILMCSKHFDQTKLTGLPDIVDVVDISNIRRLSSIDDSIELSTKIIDIICTHVCKNKKKPQKKKKQKNNGEKQTKKIKDFTNGKVKKKSLKKDQQKILKDVSDNNVNINTVGGIPSLPCIYIDGIEGCKKEHHHFIGSPNYSLKAVQDGLSNGKKLSNKLKIIDEVKDTPFLNKRNGKINQSYLYSAPLGNENIFQQIHHSENKETHFHISIDASGSMCGIKWYKTFTMATALCYTSLMIDNLSIVLTLRGMSCYSDGVSIVNDKHYPCLLKLFDSKKHSVNYIKRNFPTISPRSATPEGLTYNCLLKTLPEPSENLNVFFINISDGEPAFAFSVDNQRYYYHGVQSYDHTNNEFKKIKNSVNGCMCYYITETLSGIDKSKNAFQRMYGSCAEFIDISNSNQISNSINNILIKS